MKLEKYIELRLKKDHLNYLEIKNIEESKQYCYQYIEDYFELLMNGIIDCNFSINNSEKINDRFRNKIKDYSLEVQLWLQQIYVDYDADVLLSIIMYVNKDKYFNLYFKDEQFRLLATAYIKSKKSLYPYIINYEQEIVNTIKDYQRISGDLKYSSIDYAKRIFNRNPEIKKFITNISDQYNVNIYAWCIHYINQIYQFKNDSILSSIDFFIQAESWTFSTYSKSDPFSINNICEDEINYPFLKENRVFVEYLLLFVLFDQFVGNDNRADILNKYHRCFL